MVTETDPKATATARSTPVPKVQVIAAMLWPSFLTAGVATILFFTAFDPAYVFSEYDISRMGAYSVGFLCFWALTASSCMISAFFLRPCHTPCKALRDMKEDGNGTPSSQ
ncbi:MAG: hypothetical protein ACPGU7_05605 [Gammaproteobacteria bacterium]